MKLPRQGSAQLTDARRARRWRDFRRRVDHAPHEVYRHRERGWEYIPIHPFGDEPDLLDRLGLRPEDCRCVDAWWGIDGDATLLQAGVVGAIPGPAGLFATPTPHREGWTYLVAVIEAPILTRGAFEAAMTRFADAGFPHDRSFRLRWADPRLDVAEHRKKPGG